MTASLVVHFFCAKKNQTQSSIWKNVDELVEPKPQVSESGDVGLHPTYSGISFFFFFSIIQSLITWFTLGFIKWFRCGPFMVLRGLLYGVHQWWKTRRKCTGMGTANSVGMQKENKHDEKTLIWSKVQSPDQLDELVKRKEK